MADTKIENVEPDPAATSLSNDETVNKPTESVAQTETTAKTETSDATAAGDDTAKDVKAETEGNVVNGDEKQGNGEAKTEDAESKLDDKKRKADDTDSPQKRKKYDNDSRPQRGSRDDPKAKYRTSGLRDRGNRFDPNVKKETDDPAEIRKQVEFYFSESNLARDDFLYGKVEGPKNNPVELKTICSFKRMRRFQPFEAVVKALKESTVVDVLDDDKDKIKVQRKTPISKDFEDKSSAERTQIAEEQSMARSVYAKGFGLEEPSTQFDLEAFFSRLGDVNSVRLRRADDKSFKGSVFVEFGDVETAQKFLAQDPKPTYKERELLIKSKKEYCDEKLQLIKDGKIEPKKNSEHRRDPRSDDRDWRTRRDQDSKNGFREDRGGRGGRGRGRGRGGNDRGRGGRGGRGGNRGDRRGGDHREGGRDNDRNAEREAKAKADAPSTENGDKQVTMEAPKAEAVASDATSNKRARDDDAGESREAKKEKLDSEV